MSGSPGGRYIYYINYIGTFLLTCIRNKVYVWYTCSLSESINYLFYLFLIQHFLIQRFVYNRSPSLLLIPDCRECSRQDHVWLSKPVSMPFLFNLLSEQHVDFYPSFLKLSTFGFSDATTHWLPPTSVVILLQSPLLALSLGVLRVLSPTNWHLPFTSTGLPWWLSGRVHLPMQEMQVWSLGWEDSLEKKMVTHSCLETPGNREAWWATVHEVTRASDTTEL